MKVGHATPKSERLSLSPQHVDHSTWYYEEPKGVCVVRQIRLEGVLRHSDMFYLPWKMLMASIDRKRAVLKRQRQRRKK